MRRRLSDTYDQNLKKKINFLIFGRFKRKNPCAVGSNHRILDRNVVVPQENSHFFLSYRSRYIFYYLDFRGVHLDAINRDKNPQHHSFTLHHMALFNAQR